MKTTHTALPWYDDSLLAPSLRNVLARTCHGLPISGGSIGPIWQAEDDANATFIVQACNSHVELVAALELVAPYVRILADDGYLTELAVTEFRAALAKAK